MIGAHQSDGLVTERKFIMAAYSIIEIQDCGVIEKEKFKAVEL